MNKRLPIGVSDFKEVREENYYYVDKSLLIQEMINSGSKAILLSRPRRFGKTLNLSMLRYFYEKTEQDTSILFEGLAIAQQGEQYMQEQGKYPVIFLSLKDIKSNEWAMCLENFKKLIADEYRRHRYLLADTWLDEFEKQEYIDIIGLEGTQNSYESSLKQLSTWLHRYHQQRAVILIDEYDTPIQQGYLHGFYDEVIQFTRNWLSGGLKDNPSLEKGILTGILRVAKESIFSGLNHLEVCTILSHAFSQHFGLLETEVVALLNDYGIGCELDEVKKWYNGYLFGDSVIYNPWSILNYTKSWRDGFCPYWINTSSNDLIREILTESSGHVKTDMERLLRGESIMQLIDENIVFQNIKTNAKALWSLLLFSGYVTMVSKKQGKRLYVELAIPNRELESLYEEVILSWFEIGLDGENHRLMLEALVNGDLTVFTPIFQDFVRSTFSMFDTSGADAEKVYHAFVLSLLVRLQDRYVVKSNRESGYGRYDVLLIPKDKHQLGIVIEFKKARNNESLQTAVTAALAQIADKQYVTELHAHGIQRTLQLGIAFAGKQVEIAAREGDNPQY